MVISLGNKPGSIQLTRIRSGYSVCASWRLRCVNAALLAAYAYWPADVDLTVPEILDIFIIEEECPGTILLPLSRAGISLAVTK